MKGPVNGRGFKQPAHFANCLHCAISATNAICITKSANVIADQNISSMMQVLILGDKGELFLSGRPLSNDVDMMEDALMLPQPYSAEDLDDFPPPAVCQPEDEACKCPQLVPGYQNTAVSPVDQTCSIMIFK